MTEEKTMKDALEESENTSENITTEELNDKQLEKKNILLIVGLVAIVLVVIIVVAVVMHAQKNNQQKKASGKGKYEEAKEYQDGEYYADVDIFDVAKSQFEASLVDSEKDDVSTEEITEEDKTTEHSTTTEVETSTTQEPVTTTQQPTTTQAPTTTEVVCEHNYEYVFITGTGHFEAVGEPIYVREDYHFCYSCPDCGFYEDVVEHHYLNCPDCTSDNIELEYEYIEEVTLTEPIYEQKWVIDVPDFEGYECTKCGHRKPL